MAKPTQETPLQAALRTADVSTTEELQKKQAAARAGQPPPETAEQETELEPAELEPEPSKQEAATSEVPAVFYEPPKPRAQKGTQITQDGSPLADAARQAGVTTVEALQKQQAAARAVAVEHTPAETTESVGNIQALDLAGLAEEIRKAEAEEQFLTVRIGKAQRRVSEIKEHIDSLRAQHMAATHIPNEVANQNYLEASKRAMEARFAVAIKARDAVAAIDPQLQLDKDALGLTKSPLDRAIAQRLTAERRAASNAVLQATQQKK